MRWRSFGWTACSVLLSATFAACSRGNQSARFSGTVQAPSAAVGSTIGGRVGAVLVTDGSRVRKGEVLVRLDDAQQRAALAHALQEESAAAASLADLRAGSRAPDVARAQALAAAERERYESAARSQPAQVDVFLEQVRQAQAQGAQARAVLRDASSDAQRNMALFRTGDVSAQARDAAVARAAQARGQLASAEASERAAQANLGNARSVTLPRTAAAALAAYRAAQEQVGSLAAGARPDAIRQAQATLAAAHASVADARARAAEQVIRTPADGRIAALNLHAGDLVAPGAAVATVDEDGEPYVRVYVPQSQLGRFHLGADIDVYPDATQLGKLRGTLEAIDDRAQFTPQNVETADDRAHLSFGVKVRIHDRASPLSGGTTASVALP